LSSPVLRNYRGRFPFKLATTSYIYPDEIVPNVAKLAPYFDEIELVLFEGEGQGSIPNKVQINNLIKLSHLYQLGFNVHLPIDIFLGDESDEIRSKGVSIVKKVIERTLPLNPSVYILHLDLRNKTGQNQTGVGIWQRRIGRSIKEMAGYGIELNRISIETLGYPFEWIEAVVKEFGFSICLDIGHILFYGQDLQSYLDSYLPNTSIIHLHGFQNGIDHLGIDRLPESPLKLILSSLRNYRGIVSLEVFSMEDLNRSLITLEELWGRR
jgi:sugar phosphate isomerase/epimerase